MKTILNTAGLFSIFLTIFFTPMISAPVLGQEKKLPPQKTDTQIISDAETYANEFQTTIKKSYPSNETVQVLIVHKKFLEHIIANNSKEKQKAQSLSKKIEILIRNGFAMCTEKVMLEKSINAEVSATGTDKTTLKYTYVLMSKAMAYQLANEGAIYEVSKSIGFKKVIFSDGFNQTWTYDLTD